MERGMEMVRLVGLEPTTGKTPVDFKPTAYANFATAAPATRPTENITGYDFEQVIAPVRAFWHAVPGRPT